MLARTPDKQTTTVRKAFARALGLVPCAMCNAPCALRKTLTYDQGSADLDKFSQAALDEIAEPIIDRPSENLGCRTPNKVFATMLAGAAVKD